MSAEEFKNALASEGIENVFVGATLAEVIAQVADASQGRNWWDVLVVAAICLLVLELIVANRRPGLRQAGQAGAVGDLTGAATG